MDVVDAIKAIENYFKDNWTSTPVEWPAQGVVPQSDTFVRFSAKVEDWGGNVNGTWRRYFGTAWSQVLIQKGESSWEAWQYAQDISDLLSDKTISGIKLMTAEFREIGIVGDTLNVDASWYRVDVIIQFLFEKNV